jgi:hypothetical protein
MRASIALGRFAAGLLLSAGLIPGAQAAGTFDFSGSAEVGYAHIDTPGKQTNAWTGQGSANLMITDPGINAQLNFRNDAYDVGSNSTDYWGFGGDLYWRDYAGAFGANVTTHVLSSGGSGDDLSYGLFGESYLLRQLTLRLKGGHVSNNLEANYADAGMVGYPIDDIALSLDVDYAKLQHGDNQLRDATLAAEYLPVRQVPISIKIGYGYADLSQLKQNLNILSVGLKVYFGGEGHDGSLRTRQRNGAISWDGPPSTIIGLRY